MKPTAADWIGSLPTVREGPKCFAAGTPLLTPEGEKAVESLRRGDLVLSRAEEDIDGVVEAKAVEEVFVRVALVLAVQVRGRVIRTTAEHPFYVLGRGWVCACHLVAGDLLASHDGQVIPVERVAETRDLATVYNVRVADHHTYFVGSGEWGFSVWAHNAEYVIIRAPDGTYRLAFNRAGYPDIPQPLRAETLPKLLEGARARGINRIEPRILPEAPLPPGAANSPKAPPKPGTPEWTKPWPEEWSRPTGHAGKLPKNGTWSGQPGHSYFIPDNPAQLGLNPGEVIPFRQGRPDFSNWARDLNGAQSPGKTFQSPERLTGEKDDLGKMHKEIARQKGWLKANGEPNPAAAERWLQQQRLSPHHSGGNGFQLLPWELHGNPSAKPPIQGVRHVGGAHDNRNP
jgi:intein/homing endonuclease